MALPQVVYLFPQNTQVIGVQGLQDAVTGSFLNNATVFATLLDQRGNPDPVLNQIPLGYLGGTNGNYQGTVPYTFNPPGWVGKPMGGYVLQIQASQGGVQSLFTLPVQLVVRSQ